ncbi:MAG: phosphoheptose isomerase [Thaumarchaeota archaeon]|jgi:D-sedoheptulose 7-phosphate isomerase|nr:MAG: phosphoheptose isomerase [Nitrososphaerota archaeon]
MNGNQIMNMYLDSQIDCISKIKDSQENIKKIFQILLKARDKKRQIFVMGNGGSASTATHFVSDLLKTSLIKNTNRFKAFSLSDNIPVILAWANDTSYDKIFVSQLENILEKNDIIIGISGSGNSQNVLKAIKFANKMKATTISLTGQKGGKISKISKINFTVPSNDMLTIETMHLMICHLITTMLRSSGNPIFKY